MSSYPEHEKMHAVKAQSQAIGRFLDWLQNERRFEIAYDDGGTLFHANIPIESLLAEYFGIDLTKIQAEKEAMCEAMRTAARQS